MLSGMLLMVALQPRRSEAYHVAEVAAACNSFVCTLQVPVAVLWGAADPWEKVEWGRDFCPANYPAIEVLLSTQRVVHRLNRSCHMPCTCMHMVHSVNDFAMYLAGLHRAAWCGPLSHG